MRDGQPGVRRTPSKTRVGPWREPPLHCVRIPSTKGLGLTHQTTPHDPAVQHRHGGAPAPSARSRCGAAPHGRRQWRLVPRVRVSPRRPAISAPRAREPNECAREPDCKAGEVVDDVTALARAVKRRHDRTGSPRWRTGEARRRSRGSSAAATSARQRSLLQRHEEQDVHARRSSRCDRSRIGGNQSRDRSHDRSAQHVRPEGAVEGSQRRGERSWRRLPRRTHPVQAADPKVPPIHRDAMTPTTSRPPRPAGTTAPGPPKNLTTQPGSPRLTRSPSAS